MFCSFAVNCYSYQATLNNTCLVSGYLLNSHHSFHVFGHVSNRDTSETTVPADHVVVHVATDETQHVLEVRTKLGHDRRGHTHFTEGEGVHL